MGTTSILNKRTIADVKAVGTNITLKGDTIINGLGDIETVKGQIVLTSDNNKFVGNFSELGISVQDRSYTQYITEASELLFELLTAIKDEFKQSA